MTKEEFLLLTDKVNDGSATDAELALYNQYFHRVQKLQSWDESLLGDQEERGRAIYQSILDRVAAQDVPVKKLNPIWKRVVAAAAVLLLVLGLGFWLRREGSVKQDIDLIAKVNKAASTNDLIELPDGSTVILSTGSKLEYAASFDGKATREVFLTGKAFFDIKHRENQPFIVRTGEVYTQVLGTAFDVDSRNAEIKVTVIRGKVVVNKGAKTLGTLTPNKQVLYKLAEDEAVLSDTNAEESLAWKEKDLVFNDVTLQHAVALLEERYDIKVSLIGDSLAQQHFTTTLFENQSLTDCLTLICDFNNAVYTYNAITKQVIIKPKN